MTRRDDADRLGYLSATEAREVLAAGSLSAVDYIAALLSRIERKDPSLNAFISVFFDQAMAGARLADKRRVCGGPLPALHGVPFAIKDVLAVRDTATTAHSRVFGDCVEAQTAIAVQRLTDAGAILMGKLSLEECALGSPVDDLPWPSAKNPWDRGRTPGGSSSGSAVALAAGFAPLTLGTDTGGSVRAPAAYCGIVGLKPTSNRVSTAGLFPLAPTLDQVGLMTRTADDCALMFSVLADPPRNPGASPFEVRGTRVGVLVDTGEAGQTDAEMWRALATAEEILVRLGAVRSSVTLGDLGAFRDCGGAILYYEAYRFHREKLERCPEKYGETARRLLRCGASISSAQYREALKQRPLLANRVEELLLRHDVLLAPVTFGPATPLDNAAELERSSNVLFRVPFNISGHPAISVCAGFNSEGLPLAMQLVARRGEDERLLQLASAYQAVTNWHERRPSVPDARDVVVFGHGESLDLSRKAELKE